ncbi:helix-turn-helix domain-containing protein [Gordonia sp. MP11Mi]|uniref:Uncharacterized protein n=1 Tax=Gordonia sp. MP11Mi TaxID=3022769 RepID=A0AA97CXG4_9ACTN
MSKMPHPFKLDPGAEDYGYVYYFRVIAAAAGLSVIGNIAAYAVSDLPYGAVWAIHGLPPLIAVLMIHMFSTIRASFMGSIRRDPTTRPASPWTGLPWREKVRSWSFGDLALASALALLVTAVVAITLAVSFVSLAKVGAMAGWDGRASWALPLMLDLPAFAATIGFIKAGHRIAEDESGDALDGAAIDDSVDRSRPVDDSPTAAIDDRYRADDDGLLAAIVNGQQADDDGQWAAIDSAVDGQRADTGVVIVNADDAVDGDPAAAINSVAGHGRPAAIGADDSGSLLVKADDGNDDGLPMTALDSADDAVDSAIDTGGRTAIDDRYRADDDGLLAAVVNGQQAVDDAAVDDRTSAIDNPSSTDSDVVDEQDLDALAAAVVDDTNTKVSVDAVAEALRLRRDGISLAAIASRLGVGSHSTVSGLVKAAARLDDAYAEAVGQPRRPALVAVD